MPVVHNDHPNIIIWVFLPKRKYEICPSGYQYNEEYGKINMLRKVPAIKDGDFCLAERYVVYGTAYGKTYSKVFRILNLIQDLSD